MRLFISYASEDRIDFVEPLAKKLQQDHDVWFAPYELKVGDSLLTKINEGLRDCDYGVVVLSQHFFAKKWPTSELNGLFALEQPSRKIILPIWKDVTEMNVKGYSPILADRVAANASEGIEAVAAAIRLAVDTSTRQRELGIVESAFQRFKGLAETVKEHREGARLLESEAGAKLVASATGSACDIVEKAFCDLNSASTGLQFRITRGGTDGLVVDASYRLGFHLFMRNAYINTAASALFTILTTQNKNDFSGSDWDIVEKDEFKASFRKGQEVMWKKVDGDATFSTEQLAAFALGRFQGQIERVALSR